MIFTKLKLNYFGRFQNREIDLKPGINLIYGENEAGKSTLHTFIRGMLFGIERLRGRGSASKEDLYTRYLPWDYPGAYSGSMDIKIGEKEYRLQRSFHANDKKFTVLDLSTGREIKLKEGLISELVPGLTEGTFKNTISIEQLKAQTDSELAAQVRNYIANLSIAKSKEVDVAKAVSTLNEQRKQLEASQNPTVMKSLQTEIEEGLAREEKIDQLTIDLRELLKEEQNIAKQRETVLNCVDDEAAQRMEQLPAIIEKYHAYQELIRQEYALETQSKELDDKIAIWEKEQQDGASLKEDIARVQKLQSELLQQDTQNQESQKEAENLNREEHRNLSVSLLPAFAAAFLLMLITSFKPIGLILAALCCIAGVTGYILLRRNNRNRQQKLADRENALRQQKDTLQGNIDEILHKNDSSRIEGLMIKQEKALRDYYALEHSKEQKKDLEKRKSDLEDSRDTTYETIMKYMQYFVSEDELTDASIHKLQAVIAARKQETSGRLDEVNRKQENCRLSIEKLKWEISSLEGNEEELLKNRERYSELSQKQKEDAVKLEAIKLALSSIQELSSDIHDSFGQQLNSAVSDIISEVTGQKYTDLKVDEKLEVKVGWQGNYVLMERLSAGTIDQIYFALRMAVADLLLGKDNIPLLLDDSLALYDDQRIRAALAELAQRKQVLLFTCHKREQLLLKEMGMPYNYVDLSQ